MKVHLYALVAFAIIIAGCATINSENSRDRLAALAKVEGQNELKQCILESRYSDVKDAALSRITNATILVSLATDKTIDENFRNAAAEKLSEESDVLQVLIAQSVSEEVMEKLVHQIKNENSLLSVAKIEGLSNDVVSMVVSRINDEGVLLQIAKIEGLCNDVRSMVVSRINDEGVLLQIAKLSFVDEKLRFNALQRVKNVDSLFEFVVRKSMPNCLREYGRGKIAVNRKLVKQAFSECDDSEMAMKILEMLQKSETDDAGVQVAAEDWFLKVLNGDKRHDFLKLLLSRINSQEVQWNAVVCDDVSEDLKLASLERITEMKRICEVITQSRFSSNLRTCAVNRLKDNPRELEDCILSIEDVDVGIAIGRVLPKENLSGERVQVQIGNWFSNCEDVEKMSKLLMLLNVDFDLDQRKCQEKLVKLIVAADNEENRHLVRNYLVDPEMTEALAMQKGGANEGLALWATDMIASDVWLGKLLKCCRNPMIRGRAVSRLSNERVISEIAKNDDDTAVRVIAVKHLTSFSKDLLKKLVDDADPVVAKYSLLKLREFDPLKADELQMSFDAKENARKEAEEAKRKQEAQEDWERARNDTKQRIDILRTSERQILDCQGAARIYNDYDCAPNCVLELDGTVLELERNWIFADEIHLLIEGNGHGLTVRCKMKDSLSGNLNKTDRITISGKFLRGDQATVVLEDSVVKR